MVPFGSRLLAAGTLAAVLIVPQSLRAHPHVVVQTRAEIIIDVAGKIMAIRHAWTFDDAYSAFLGQGLDKNGDGKLSREELADLAKVNVESLADTAYFTVAKIAGKPLEFAAPTDYFLEQNDLKLTLHYTLPLAQPQPPGVAFFLEVFDPTFFVAFNLDEAADAAKLTGAPAGCKLSIRRPARPAATMLGQFAEQVFQGGGDKALEIAVQTTARIHVACP